MNATLTDNASMAQQNQLIADIVARERLRLRSFILRRVPDPGDAEDIMQDVLFEFVAAYRLPEPIEQVGAWLMRVARNRIIDRFRKHREEALPQMVDDEHASFDDLLPSPNAGPEAAYAHGKLLEALQEALMELPQEQRDVFIAHEIDGHSFKEIAQKTGVSINTLLARKRYAMLHLRRRLREIHEAFRN